MGRGLHYTEERAAGMDMSCYLILNHVCWKRLASRPDRAWLAVSDGRRNVLLHFPPNVPVLSQLCASRNAFRLTQHK